MIVLKTFFKVFVEIENHRRFQVEGGNVPYTPHLETPLVVQFFMTQNVHNVFLRQFIKFQEHISNNVATRAIKATEVQGVWKFCNIEISKGHCSEPMYIDRFSSREKVIQLEIY